MNINAVVILRQKIYNNLVATSDRLGVTMHPAQPDWTFDEIVKV